MLGQSNRPSSQPGQIPVFELYAIGDTWNANGAETTGLSLLLDKFKEGENGSGVIFTGDNFSPYSLTSENKQIEMLRTYQGKIFVIPGKKEWKWGQGRGQESLEEYQRMIKKSFRDKSVNLIDAGCPGPLEIFLTEQITLIMLDTQWWLDVSNYQGEKDYSGCDIKDEDDIMLLLVDALLRNRDKTVIVAAHHPLFSQGPHGGKFPTSLHFTPPLLGSLYVGYRKGLGNLQDLSSPRYSLLQEKLLKVLSQHPRLIYISGKEASQQLFQNKDQYYLVTGAGSRSRYVKTGKPAMFTSGAQGYSLLKFYGQGEIWVEFWGLDRQDKGKLLYENQLYGRVSGGRVMDLSSAQIDYSNQTTDLNASMAYGKYKKKPGFLGNNYRREWREIIKGVPYFEMGKEKGGLQVVQRGGGMQTKSLRLENEQGQQFVLRSIEKYPEAAVPKGLQGTLATDLVKDMISAAHPYAAFVIPPLADAGNIYHTNPQLVYLPSDPRLGHYQKAFGGGLYLYEERPAHDRSDVQSFGRSKKVINTKDVLEEIRDENEHYVDQKWALRSRLFDIWIGDWDRHDDQWRWASFKDENKNTYYRPIPRDRDQAFFYSDGTLLKYATAQPSLGKFQGFDYKIKNINTFCYNGRHFDSSFISEPSLEDWVKQANYLKSNLSDEVIKEAINRLPPEVFQYSGNEIIGKLKSRRNDLDQYAREYYHFLALEVDVVGSDEAEFFQVNRINDQQTEVNVFDIRKKAGAIGRKLYSRTFVSDETKEIRLYGLGGDDRFEVEGEVQKGIKLRIVGGEGEDSIKDISKVKGWSRLTKVYDTNLGNTFELGSESQNLTSNRPGINRYSRKAFKYNTIAPLFYLDISPDDGVFLTFEAKLLRYGFRKEPYKSRQKFKFRWSPSVNSYRLSYLADFVHVLGNWDLLLDTDIRWPSYTDYYYGLGNESTLDRALRKDKFYQFRYAILDFKPLAKKRIRENHRIALGPIFQAFALSENNDPNRQFQVDFPNSDLDQTKFYTGTHAQYVWDTRDNDHKPTRGLYSHLEANHIFEPSGDSINFGQFMGDVAAYLTFPGSLPATFAFRLGGAINVGDYEFYQANDLGGEENLRGHRRIRFSGDKSAYFNSDLRLQLFTFRTILFSGSFGVFGFYDSGRVWYKDANGLDPTTVSGSSNLIHQGYGGGFWIAPFNNWVFSASVSNSSTDRDVLVNFNYGFLF